MEKKLTLSLVLAAFLGTMVLASSASAGFDEHKLVGAVGSTTEKTTFGFDETPYLYLKLHNPGTAGTSSFWRGPDDSSLYSSTFGTDLERWVSIVEWKDIRQTGEWEINSSYFYTNGANDFGSSSFTVTPEPLTTTLFLIGGLPIATSIYRKKKKSIAV